MAMEDLGYLTQIFDEQRNKSSITNLNANGIPVRSCCALSFYSICFSFIKACSYWNSDFLNMEAF